MNDQYRAFVDCALGYCGAPYIWQGKGLLLWTPTKMQPHNFTDINDSLMPICVFDCSGLVTHCIWKTTYGAVDLRASHSAKTILDTFPECSPDFGDGCLVLYPGHVAIDIGRNRVVDANRGDHTTNSLLAAQQKGAKVEVHRSVRPPSSILGYRRIPLTVDELVDVAVKAPHQP